MDPVTTLIQRDRQGCLKTHLGRYHPSHCQNQVQCISLNLKKKKYSMVLIFCSVRTYFQFYFDRYQENQYLPPFGHSLISRTSIFTIFLPFCLFKHCTSPVMILWNRIAGTSMTVVTYNGSKKCPNDFDFARQSVHNAIILVLFVSIKNSQKTCNISKSRAHLNYF